MFECSQMPALIKASAYARVRTYARTARAEGESQVDCRAREATKTKPCARAGSAPVTHHHPQLSTTVHGTAKYSSSPIGIKRVLMSHHHDGRDLRIGPSRQGRHIAELVHSAQLCAHKHSMLRRNPSSPYLVHVPVNIHTASDRPACSACGRKRSRVVTSRNSFVTRSRSKSPPSTGGWRLRSIRTRTRTTPRPVRKRRVHCKLSSACTARVDFLVCVS